MRIASDYDMKNFKNIPNSRKVMIIEDLEDLLILYKDYLRKNGCEVMATSTTAEEISYYKSYRPDFLIMDYKLPGSGKTDCRPRRRSLLQIPGQKSLS